jgi:hypothetical protein
MKTNWTLAFASAIGSSHVKNNTPCQDAHRVKRLSRNCGIAIVADGAGSKYLSQLGSKFLVDNGIKLFTEVISKTSFLKKKKPLRKDHWRRIVLKCFTQLHKDLTKYAENNGFYIKEASSTLIVVVFSPGGIMSAHIGDGRAAYCNTEKQWQPIIKPFSGEEVGTTVFFTTNAVWNNPDKYIETRVIKDQVTGFSLLSDGMEKISFECYVKDSENRLYIDPNKPFDGFFNPIRKSLLKMTENNWNQRKINVAWKGFLTNGNERIKNESDDKTMVIGVL